MSRRRVYKEAVQVAGCVLVCWLMGLADESGSECNDGDQLGEDTGHLMFLTKAQAQTS
jgi:hypothetical protein